MKRIINDIKEMVKSRLYYGSLALSLSAIDICSKIEYPNMKKQTLNAKTYNAFMKWIDNFFIPIIEKRTTEPIINSNDIYSLRCKVLHEGTLNIENPDLSQIILSTGGSHRNKAVVSNGKITITETQLNPLLFVDEIVLCIEEWIKKKSEEDITLSFNITSTFSSANLDGSQVFFNCN